MPSPAKFENLSWRDVSRPQAGKRVPWPDGGKSSGAACPGACPLCDTLSNKGVQGICAGPQAPPFGLTKRQRWNRPRRGSPSMPSEQMNYPVDFVAACVGPEGRLA